VGLTGESAGMQEMVIKEKTHVLLLEDVNHNVQHVQLAMAILWTKPLP
jgi:hypothetical protein